MMRLFTRIGGRKQPVRLALVGLCGGISHAFFSAAAAEAPLPVVELSALHRRFGGLGWPPGASSRAFCYVPEQ
eukprot:s1081_g3.t1